MGLSLSQGAAFLSSAGVIANPIAGPVALASKALGLIGIGKKKKTQLESAQQFQRDALADLQNPAKRGATLDAIQYRASAGFLASIEPNAAAVYLATLDQARQMGAVAPSSAPVSFGNGAMASVIAGVATNDPALTGGMGMGTILLLGGALLAAFLLLRKG